MKIYWMIGGIAPCILYLSTRWRWGCFTPGVRTSQCPLDRRLGGLHGQSGCVIREKKSHYCSCWEL